MNKIDDTNGSNIMANVKQPTVYVSENWTPLPQKATKKKEKPPESKRLSHDDMQLVEALEAVKSDIAFLHNCFDQATDAIIIDSLTYEIKAMNLRYEYYLTLCKQKGIVNGFGG